MFRLASVWPLSTSGWWLYWWSVFLSIVLLFPKVLITKKPGSQRYISFSQPFLKTLFNKCIWSLPSCFYYSNHLGIIQICSYKLRLIRHHGSESPYQYLVLLQLQETKFQWHYVNRSRRKMKDYVLSIGRRLKRLVIGVQQNAWSWTWLVYSKWNHTATCRGCRVS